MSRKTMLQIPLVLIGVLLTGILGLVAWILLAIPVLVNPGIVPDPRNVISGVVTRHAIKSMMKGGPLGAKKAA